MPGWGCRKEATGRSGIVRCVRGQAHVEGSDRSSRGPVLTAAACGDNSPASRRPIAWPRGGRSQFHCLPTSASRQETTISGQALTESARGKTTCDWRSVCSPAARDVR
jgi:hypothetical protein